MRWLGFAVGLALLSCLALWMGGRLRERPPRADPRPNIVLILSDDEDVEAHAFLPKTKTLLHDQGTTFANFFVSYSLCCPSRATILRGQYPHNTGIEGNRPPQGGFQKALESGLEKSTVATWLQDAGYHTMLAGKYLNGYGGRRTPPLDRTYVPRGWTEWYGGLGRPPYEGYGYTVNENGELVTYGYEPEDYVTDVISRKAVDTIRGAVREEKPFFLYLAPFAPHWPARPAARHMDLFGRARLPRPPSFDEVHVGDKPALVRNRRRISRSEIVELEELYRERLRSLQAIDDLVETVVTTLREAEQLENTYLVYTSDHGFHLGQHRLQQGKNTPYEEDIRVPFVLRGPGVPPGSVVEQLVLNNDIAPTLAEIAGEEPPDFVDGRSFLSLAQGHSGPWRQSFMIQRAGSVESQGEEGDADEQMEAFRAIRTTRYSYVEWAGGDRELYDLHEDPHQLESSVSRDPALVRGLTARLTELGKCKEVECRQIEDLPIGVPP